MDNFSNPGTISMISGVTAFTITCAVMASPIGRGNGPSGMIDSSVPRAFIYLFIVGPIVFLSLKRGWKGLSTNRWLHSIYGIVISLITIFLILGYYKKYGG